MKGLKRIICLFFLQLVVVIYPLAMDALVSFDSQANDQEKEGKVESIIDQAREYCRAEKFDEARQLVEKSLDKFKDKEDQKKLQIEMADVHYWWADNLKRKYDYENSIKHFEVAFSIDKIHRVKNAAIVLNNIGILYDALNQKEKALDYLQKALPIMRTVGDRGSEAKTLHNIGKVCSDMDQKQKALNYYEKALPIARDVGDRTIEAMTLNKIGDIYNVLGQKKKAIEYYEKALLMKRAVRDHAGEAVIFNKIGRIYSTLAQKQQALDYYQKALDIMRAIRNRTGEYTTLDNIGHVYYDLGQKQQALDYYQKALAIKKDIGDRAGEAATLSNIGRVYSDLGQEQQALDYYEKALPIIRALGDRAREATTLNNIGIVYDALGQKQKALDYYQEALPILRVIEDRANEGITLNNIGGVYSVLGKKQKALDYYQKALLIKKAVGDRAGEAETLNYIGLVYDDLGQKQKALDYFQKALLIMKAVKDRNGEAMILNSIGKVYSYVGQSQKALDYFQKALSIMRDFGDCVGEATVLNNIGFVYSEVGQKQKALDYYQQALPLRRAVGDRVGEAVTLSNIGLVYSKLGQKQKALDYYQQSLPLSRAIGDRAGEAITLNNIGSVYDDLGQKQKALDYYQQALPIMRAVGDRDSEAKTLNNIGGVYSDLGQKQKALEYYQKALPIMREVGDRAREATALNSIGGVYSALGQKQKALDYYEKALALKRAVGDRAGEATTLNSIGGVYSALGQKQKALDYYEKALPLRRAVGDRAGETITLNNIMLYWNSLKNSPLSIYYGKQSVNILQKLRENISGLEKEIKQSYLKSESHTYRYLAELLVEEGRLSEAQHVLDMLKEEEYFQFIRRDWSTVIPAYPQMDFSKFEKQWFEKYSKIMVNLSNITNEYHSLKIKTIKNDAEKKRMEELEPHLEEAQKTYENFLTQLKNAFDKHEKEIKKGRPDPDTLANKVSALQETLKYLDEKEGGKNASLHFLVYGGRISVIFTTPSSQSVKQTEIDEKEFNQMIMNYMNLNVKLGEKKREVRPLETPNDNIERQFEKKKEYEKQLYNLIFKPIDEELKKYGATNLMISLDGVLRYIPLPALWNGESYVLQRYRIALITTSSLKSIRDIPVKDKKILGMGASRGGHGFKRLPYVRREIRSIVRDEEKGYDGLIKGKALIDDNFTKDTMVNQLKNKKYPLVHISSHFKFSPGDETKNFLLLGDGNIIKLSEIRRLRDLFDNVKLLVLSACQTGVGGNGEEIDGFGELAQQSGAKSVIASLWPVADESTKELMVKFYRILKRGKVTSKIEALRQAQLELAGLEDLLQKEPHKRKRSKSKYSHPYYWGPFIMIGNWR